jgi:small subunit ribosomal protein S3
MARQSKEREGRVPLSTLQAHVDYGTALAKTTYGVIGVKVWIYKGDIERGKFIDFKQQGGGGPSRGGDRPRFNRPDRGGDRGGDRGDRGGPGRSGPGGAGPKENRNVADA